MSARPSNPCGDLQSLADRAVAFGPEHGRTKELMGWAVCEIERLRAELETVTAARDRWHRKYEGACATIDTYSSDETFRDGLFPAWKPITDRPKESGGYWIWSPATGPLSEWVGHWAYRADLGRWGTEGDYAPQSGSYWMPLPKPPRGELKANACQCDPNPSIGGSPPCPVHDGESEDDSHV